MLLFNPFVKAVRSLVGNAWRKNPWKERDATVSGISGHVMQTQDISWRLSSTPLLEAPQPGPAVWLAWRTKTPRHSHLSRCRRLQKMPLLMSGGDCTQISTDQNDEMRRMAHLTSLRNRD